MLIYWFVFDASKFACGRTGNLLFEIFPLTHLTTTMVPAAIPTTSKMGTVGIVRTLPGQDIELDCDPFWLFTTKGPFNLNEMDVAVDSGDGFETDKEFIRTRDTDPSSTNVYWSKARVYRIRLAAGQPAKILNLTVDKKALEKPLPPVLPQAIGELIIKETGIHVLTNRKVVIDLTFLNNSAVSTMAVAMHDQGCIVMPCSLNTFLVASDGTPYVIDTSGLAGINGLRTRPQLSA